MKKISEKELNDSYKIIINKILDNNIKSFKIDIEKDLKENLLQRLNKSKEHF